MRYAQEVLRAVLLAAIVTFGSVDVVRADPDPQECFESGQVGWPGCFCEPWGTGGMYKGEVYYCEVSGWEGPYDEEYFWDEGLCADWADTECTNR
jgi:hypothetical protein